jgi:hypothetical protein
MTDHGCDGAVSESRSQSQDVPDLVKSGERTGVVVIANIPTRSAPVASPVRSNYVKPGLGDRQHYLSPAIRELRKSVKQHNAGPVLHLEARLEDMHSETVNIVDEARAYAGRENCLTVRRRFSRALGGRLCAGDVRTAEWHHCSLQENRRGTLYQAAACNVTITGRRGKIRW